VTPAGSCAIPISTWHFRIWAFSDLGIFGSGISHAVKMVTRCQAHVGATTSSAMPPHHYFDESPQSRSDERTIDVVLPDVSFSMRTDRGVFSHGRLDTGTAILLRGAPPPPPDGTFVDLGCGAGPIALTLAMRSPLATVLAVDVNERARSLCRENAARLGLTNVTVSHPEEVHLDLGVDLIWSNPPIRVGKPALHAMLQTWLGRLGRAGSAILVVQRNLGADALDRWLRANGHPTARLASRAGYRLLECRPVRQPTDGASSPDEHSS
jgi:16S rRNA (guanine1207-N2)-methyltransferase